MFSEVGITHKEYHNECRVQSKDRHLSGPNLAAVTYKNSRRDRYSAPLLQQMYGTPAWWKLYNSGRQSWGGSSLSSDTQSTLEMWRENGGGGGGGGGGGEEREGGRDGERENGKHRHPDARLVPLSS